MKIIVFVGTRPEIIKMQPVIKGIESSENAFVFVHSGQHYDFNMSDIFINELDLPKPDFFLGVKASSQGAQTGSIIAKSEEIIQKEKPDLILVEGDTNSALGASIAASKLSVPIGHIEAGCRSFDKSMPEEINRVLISHITSLHFTPTKNCSMNLVNEGISRGRIFLTGHPLVDLLPKLMHRLSFDNGILEIGPLEPRGYVLVTVHRRENIEDKNKLDNILSSLAQLSMHVPLIFPCHPHTRLQIRKFNLNDRVSNLKMIKPVGYLQSLGLIKHARFVITDSGGIQQEAALLGAPCITVRDVTEWVETVIAGVNFIAGCDPRKIIKIASRIEDNYDKIIAKFNNHAILSMFGRPGVSKRIIDIIEDSSRSKSSS
jgi:UDP-N-acetylglucosamine 2-epimerase